jgi:F0F1-type ATP synthase alpha subunit
MLKQKQYNVYQLNKQVFDLYVAKNGYLDNLDKNEVRKTLDTAYEQFKATHQDVLDNIQNNKEISNEDEEVLRKEMKEFFENLNQ